ncbi:MAG: GNAT family N-acetyltransferase [Clostridia bacterium]|nr:GNAT family N-acetyltransferase [Clostridia bacterium]
MSVTLTPMTASDFGSFRQLSLQTYAEELLRDAAYASMEEARKEAEEELCELLPQGLATPRHFLMRITNEENASVGYLWYDTTGMSKAFIDDIYIEPPHRRCGYALSALTELEKLLSLPHIALHVFEGNAAARKLYEKAGYAYLKMEKAQKGSLYMFKRIR